MESSLAKFLQPFTYCSTALEHSRNLFLHATVFASRLVLEISIFFIIFMLPKATLFALVENDKTTSKAVQFAFFKCGLSQPNVHMEQCESHKETTVLRTVRLN